MGKKIEYFLVSRNKDTNNLKIIPINKKKGNSLEEIDLYTTSFNNEEEFTTFLNKMGILMCDNNDYFIAYPRMINGKKTINKIEVLYSKYRVIIPIAKNSLNNQLTNSMGQIDAILDGFATIMQQQGKLYKQVTSGETNVYEKFASYFVMNNKVRSESIKYRDGGWARTSYPLIRNVLEAEGRDKETYDTIKRDIYRSLLDEKLLQQTNEFYADEQITMFEAEELLQNDKVLEVINTFENLPKNTFLIDEEGTARFNKSPFITYEKEDLETLNNNLPERLQYTLQLLAMQKADYELTGEINSSSMKQGLKLILSLLKSNDELLKKSYEWCIIYNKYKDLIKGDINGRGYQKERREF